MLLTIAHNETNSLYVNEVAFKLAKNIGIKKEWLKICNHGEIGENDKFLMLCGSILTKELSKKPLKENLGKIFEFDGKTATLYYPLNFIVKNSIEKCKQFQFALGVLKNVMVQKEAWVYEDGRIRRKG